MLKSTDGFAYPSGHSTQSNLIYLVLSDKYPKYRKELKKLKGKNLGCWCKPNKCHGDRLLELIEEYDK